jgi:hypothetical protein
MANFKPSADLLPRKETLPIEYEAKWAAETFWTLWRRHDSPTPAGNRNLFIAIQYVLVFYSEKLKNLDYVAFRLKKVLVLLLEAFFVL